MIDLSAIFLFKEARMRNEIRVLDSRLVRILEDMYLYTWAKTGQVLTVTQVLAGSHAKFNKRACDLRSRDLPGSTQHPSTHLCPEDAFAYELRDYINGRYRYGKKSQKTGNEFQVCVFGNNDPRQLHEDHFHVQVPGPFAMVAQPLNVAKNWG